MTTTALAAVMMIGAPQASAQNLFEFLFGENNRNTRQVQPEVETPQRTQPVSLPRVSGPSFYDYRTEPLVRVDFSAIELPLEEARAVIARPDLLVASSEGFDAELIASSDRQLRAIADQKAEAEAELALEDETEVETELELGADDTDEGSEVLATAGDEDAAEELVVTVESARRLPVREEIPDEADTDPVLADDAAAEPVEDLAGIEEPLRELLETDVSLEDDARAGEHAAGEGAVEESAIEEIASEVQGAGEIEEEVAIGDFPDRRNQQDVMPSMPDAEAEAEAEPEVEIVEEGEPVPLRLTDSMVEGLDQFELLAEKATAEALVEHYSANPDFIWVSDGRPNAAASQALDVLAGADSHGLDPDHYRVAAPRANATDSELARFEMELSARTLRYVRDVHGGRIDPNRISGYHDFEVKDIDYLAELETLSRVEDVRAHLESRHPANDFYRTLRAELEMLRVAEENDIVIDLQGLIRPGHTNSEFAKILKLIERDADDAFLAEHGEVLARHRGSDVYDQELVPVIRGAQAARNLSVDGIIGPQTVRGLAGESVAGRVEKVKLALERLRWLPSDFGNRYVLLNAPSFRAQYFENGAEKLNMRAIYGNTSRQTYFFKDRVSYVEFHPFWGVPRSILVNTYLSRLIDDPGYLDRSGFEVTDRSGRRISSSNVDWGRYGANIPYDVRQRPGPRNALGELKIMFPNRHAIYMHDTPDRHLFDRANRAISNGCVRLEDPRAMAAAVLGWDVADIAQRLQGPHSREDLNVEVPVYLTYFTAFPEASGKVAFYDDVYNRDGRLRQAIERVERLRTPSS